MSSARSVRVESNRLRFAAAHMATFGGDCEPLHGHNYDVTVEVEGTLADDSWVIDFGRLKTITRELCELLDHRFLLQRDSRVLQSEEKEGVWLIRFGEARRYEFPARDVLALPIDNSTAERLAEWLHSEIRAKLAAERISNLVRMRVGVEEMPGQAGWYDAAIGDA